MEQYILIVIGHKIQKREKNCSCIDKVQVFVLCKEQVKIFGHYDTLCDLQIMATLILNYFYI